MRKILTGSLCFMLFVHQQVAAQKTITGFTEKTAVEQKSREQKFDALLSAERIGKTIKELSAVPHHVGSVGGKAVADNMLAKFKSWGWEAKIETYQVLFPTPKTRVLEMIAPAVYKALLKEPVLKEDGTSGQADQLPTYNAWSADGDVTGELVFVNYGLPEDYEILDALGISVKGKIAIAKYGRSWRGIKPKVAQEHGAIGCIIYSDPKDDGYFQGDVYPVGAYKNEYGVQRGSIMDMVVYPGDPLTPNIGATENAKRLDRHDATNLLKIPVLPISYHDAKPLLEALEGPVAPAEWRGALPFTYHIGPGKTKVHLKVDFDWKLHPAYNVIATMKGSQYPDQWVIRGNHHDAWVNGAGDPVSGMAALLEEAQAIGQLVKEGYKPKRTLVYCGWDAEEPGLMGSTEWVEDHAAELQQKAVVYINSDGNGRGFLGAEGSHALETLVTEISKDVIDPQTNVSVFERAKAIAVINAPGAKEKKEALGKTNFTVGAMGSGSDYSSFIQHLGVSSLNLGYGGEDGGGEYHSIYDSYDDYRRFKDSTFAYGVALSKTAGRAALRMADADLLPFDFRSLHKSINGYVKDLMSKTEQLRETTATDNLVIASNSYALANDPTDHLKIPVPKSEVPYLDFSPLQNAVTELEKSSGHLSEVWSRAIASGMVHSATDQLLYRAEQQLLAEIGLPRRDWFKHTIYAPGFYTGYGVKTIPGVREAIEQRNWKEAQEQIVIVAAAINRLSAYLQKIN
ncbi:MAG: transferrin receptor-like dimerization domain-containing protein [Sediminibacterium sp.]|nr:transferrin receptor-like dimerization domain-containing protein [Sediminibacterium sp.]